MTDRYNAAAAGYPETEEPCDDALEPVSPDDAGEAIDRLRHMFADCEVTARQFFGFAREEGLDYDIRCAYAGLAGRLVRAASGLAGRLERAERLAAKSPRT